MSNLPERINVMRVISYDTARVLEDIHAETETPFDEITLEDILQRIEEWVADDFSCGYGHTASTRDLIFQDENGTEL